MIPPRNMLASLREAEPKIHTLLPPLAIFSPSSSSVFFFLRSASAYCVALLIRDATPSSVRGFTDKTGPEKEPNTTREHWKSTVETCHSFKTRKKCLSTLPTLARIGTGMDVGWLVAFLLLRRGRRRRRRLGSCFCAACLLVGRQHTQHKSVRSL